MEFEAFVRDHTLKVEELEREGSLAYWNASRSGSNDDYAVYAASVKRLEKIYADKRDFEYVKKTRESLVFDDPELRRICDILYLKYLGNQIDSDLLERMVDLSSEIDKRFSTYRPEVEGSEISTNDVYNILRESHDEKERRAVWEASKAVGESVNGKLLELIGLRNESARLVGFDNYYTMAMVLGEQDEKELLRIFDELDRLTEEPYRYFKEELDLKLSGIYGIESSMIMPWHYHDPYFQELPATGAGDFNHYYKGRDIVRLAADFYSGIGMPVDDILSRSDLYERHGKNPHAFCTDIDRKGDIRILCNIIDNNQWMDTMLHELGHGVYDKYIDGDLPWLIRIYPHLCTTEASAMYFGRLSHDPLWMKESLGLSEVEIGEIGPELKKAMRNKQLIFARWVQVMFNFEREMYRDPQQDLCSLWWDLKERFQMVRRPEGRNKPDYAAKIHIISSPVYYHNYMLGELIASQLHHCLEAGPLALNGPNGIYGNCAIGEYFREKVYKPGNILPWDKHVEMATGEPLTARYFVEQFVREQV
ncbi:MAG: M2 family metallopeptidase [Candidatus Krumholzibacteriota bacterium]|nr:M2 family metallopeptidase [Candidatus Krumholzibacteriota bacterium]